MAKTEFTPRQLVECLREKGRSGAREWEAHYRLVNDLWQTLRTEPLQFGDAYLMGLVNEEWTADEAIDLRDQFVSFPSKTIREALESELCEALAWIRDSSASIPSEDETRAEYLDRVAPL